MTPAPQIRDTLKALFEFWDAHGGIYAVRVAPVKEDEKEVAKRLVEVMDMAKSALSAPPRNCDIFSDPHEAWLEWQDACAKAYPKPGPKLLDWIFSPYKSENGGER